MKLFKEKKKKGFTIVELVIVIAVIGVLAAILIPTFVGLVNKANVAADGTLVRELNNAIALDLAEKGETKHETMTDALEATKEYGFDVSRISTKASKNKILWDSVHGVFCYLQQDATKVEYVPGSVEAGKELEAGDYRLWIISSTVDANYSTYLYKATETTFTTTKGLDVGNENVTAVTYNGGTNAQNVVIRTNSASTTLTINAEHDTVNHYGNVGKVDAQKIDMNCYNEYGTAAYVKVTEGKVVAKAGGTISVVFAANNDENAVAVIKESQGTIEKGLTVIEPVSTTNEARTNGIALDFSVDGVTAASETEEQLTAALTEREIVANTAAQSAISDLLDEEVADTVVRAVNSNSTEYYSFKDFAAKVNDGSLVTEGTTFTLMANVDLHNEEWAPIGTSEHPFKGVFDGNGYTVKNFKILTNCKNHGLFGAVKGDSAVLGSGQTALDNYWSDDSKTFDYSSFENIGQYKTVIKNLTVENAEIAETEYKAAAAVVGSALHAYLENVNVKNSTINGFKGAGGVVGSIAGCIINNCSVDSESSVYASEYHCAGIAALNSNSSISGFAPSDYYANIILHCINNADISSAKGNVGGIIGSAQNGSVAVIDCINNGDISITGDGSLYISGLVGGGNLGSYHQFLMDSTNNGNISGITSKSMSGAITYCSVKAVNVVNNGNITGTPADKMAGIGAWSNDYCEYIGCINNGTLTNNNPNGTSYEINDNAHLNIVGGQFDNVAALNTYLESIEEKNIKLQCIVTDNTGTLVIPDHIISISSNTKVCSTIQLGQDRTEHISIQLPEINYEYNGGYTIWFTCENSTITVPQNITVPLLSVAGTNTTVTINGTVTGGVSVRDVVTVNNNGTIGYIYFTGVEDAVMTFNNNGAVDGVDGSAKHSVCTTGKVNLTVNNHGSIKAGEGNYALLFYGNSTVVFNAYAGSTITKASGMHTIAINNGPSAHAKSMTINVAEGADGVNGITYYGESAFSAATYDCTLVINFNVVLPE